MVLRSLLQTLAIDYTLHLSYKYCMDIITASIPLAVRSPVKPRPLQQAKATSASVAHFNPETLATVNASNSTATINKSLAVLDRQRFEFSLRIITGAFSRLVINILGLKPNVPPSLVTTGAVQAIASQSAISTENRTALQPQQGVTPLTTENNLSLPVNQVPTQEIVPPMPELTNASPTVHSERAQAVAIQPLTLPQPVQVSPSLETVAAISPLSPYMALGQHKGHKLDIFDVTMSQNRDTLTQDPSSKRLDLVA